MRVWLCCVLLLLAILAVTYGANSKCKSCKATKPKSSKSKGKTNKMQNEVNNRDKGQEDCVDGTQPTTVTCNSTESLCVEKTTGYTMTDGAEDDVDMREVERGCYDPATDGDGIDELPGPGETKCYSTGEDSSSSWLDSVIDFFDVDIDVTCCDTVGIDIKSNSEVLTVCVCDGDDCNTNPAAAAGRLTFTTALLALPFVTSGLFSCV